MDPISHLDPVLEALRRQLTQNIDRLRRSGQLGASSASAGTAERAAGAAEDLEAALRRKLSAIDKRTAEGRIRATRAFVETVLAAEFGEGLMTDPGVGDMINEISGALREDAVMRERIDNIVLAFS